MARIPLRRSRRPPRSRRKRSPAISPNWRKEACFPNIPGNHRFRPCSDEAFSLIRLRRRGPDRSFFQSVWKRIFLFGGLLSLVVFVRHFKHLQSSAAVVFHPTTLSLLKPQRCPEWPYFAKYDPSRSIQFTLVLFSFVFVCRDLVASRRRQHIVFGRRRLKLMFAAMNRIAKLVGLAGLIAQSVMFEKPSYNPFPPQTAALPDCPYFAKYDPSRSIQFILVLFSFVFVSRDLGASRRRQHIVFGRRRLKLTVRRNEQDREARRMGGAHCAIRDV